LNITPPARKKRRTFQLKGRGGRAGLAALAGLAQRVVGVLGTFLIFPKVLHALGTERFGIWTAATSMILFITIADFGIGPAIMTLLPRAIARGDDAPRSYVGAAIALATILAVVLAPLGAVACTQLTAKGEFTAFLVAVFGVLLNVPLGIANPIWLALQKGWMVAIWDFVQTTLMVVLLVVFTSQGRGLLSCVCAVYGSLLTANAVNMVVLLSTHRDLRPRWSARLVATIAEVIRSGLAFFLLATLDALSYMLDNVFALRLLGPGASAQMAVVQKICITALGLIMVVSQPLWPAFADAAGRGDRVWLLRAALRGSLLVCGLAVGGSALIIGFGLPVLRLWLGASLGFDQSMLWVAGLWILSLSIVRVQIILLNALHIVRFQIGVFAIATALSLTLKVVLAPRLGIAGILIATAATFPLIVLPAVLWRVRLWRRSLPEIELPSGIAVGTSEFPATP
jgi:O-antigen/teichoic acid export membrane protein